MSNLCSNIKLRKKQNTAYNLMSLGKSVFLTGAGGTGKSSVIKMFVKMNKRKVIGLTSTTGTSALLIGGVTLHSFTGIGLGKGSVNSITTNIFKRSYIRKRWNDLEVLIIDEVSMLSPDLFDKLEEIARIVRHSELPFGGIQLILSGDFCQLPCIDSNDFCFEAKCWDKCVDETIYLTEIIRQSDTVFQECLNNVRIGNLTDKTIELLKGRVGVELKNDYGIIPTKLYPKNYSVDNTNNRELDKLAESGVEFFEYKMEATVYSNTKNKSLVLEKFKKYCNAQDTLQLCVGAQVMLLYNLDMENKLANGSRGVVVKFVDDLPMVKFISGVERVLDYHVWEMEENDEKVMSAIQIPLKVAYAFSIHKSQGCSLDYAEIDLSEIFEYGQGYCALSRMKNIEGLSITNIDFDKIQAHPKAVEYYTNLS
jgi:ATP-dependent DNA helicase PIF1